MSAFIGPLGGLVEVAHYKGSVGVTQDRPVSFKRTLGGGRVGFSSPNLGLRSWDVSAPSLSPEQYTPLEMLLAYGKPPFVWVDPLAQVSNVLGHRASLPGFGNEFAYSSNGSASAGVIPGVGSVPAVSAAGGEFLWFGYGCPVVPDVTVTVSAWVRGASEIHAVLVNGSGVEVSRASKSFPVSGVWGRVHVAARPNTASHEVRVLVSGPGAFDAALPAVTWTPDLRPWSVGRGAPKVMVSDYSDDLKVAGAQAVKDTSFKVTEVGTGASR